ncbi:MAG: hypothetical protein JNM02_07275, partial [Anaerolineales bacterium]|nr:hypothetical protein [Anaerolineales bacterium]
AYKQIVKNNDAATTKSASEPMIANVQFTATQAPTAQPLVISPEQATTVAIDFLGDTNVYSVESVIYENASAYLVTFSSGNLVYVSPSGEIIANTTVQPVYVAASSSGGGGGGGGGNNGGSNSGGDDHDDDHDEHDDDDD